MSDQASRKDEIELEMGYLRKRLDGLREELAEIDGATEELWRELNPREERESFDAEVEIAGIAESLEAHGIDRSDSGACVEFAGDLRLRLSFGEEAGGVRLGRLAWARRMGDGRTRIGVEFE